MARTHIFAAVGFPIFLALLFATWQARDASDANDIESSLLDEPSSPALELLQRRVKVIHAPKKPIEHLESHEHKVIHTSTESVELLEFHKNKDTIHIQDESQATTTNSTDSSDFGISANGVGNLPVFLTGLATDAAVVAVCLVIFAFASKRYPIMYMDNALKGFAPTSTIPEGFFGWAHASWSVSVDQVWNTAGLDHAQLLEFSGMCLNCFKWIALPMFFIMGPMNCAFGGNAAGQDHESWFSMGNVEYYCWLYWPISVAIWYVTWCVTSMCHKGMKEFMPRRFEWLRAMEKTRANTIMMIGIPAEHQSDKACKDFWNTILPNAVESVNLTKDTTIEGNLGKLVAMRDDSKYQLKIAEGAWEKDGKDQDKRPTIKTSYFGSHEDAIDYHTKAIAGFEPEIQKERARVYELAKQSPGPPNLSTGFVTFKDRKDAEVALRLDLSDNIHEWVLDYPPNPSDVIWSDLTQDPRAETSRALLGYALTAGMVIVYMPCVVFMCNIATSITLPGPLQSVWSSEAPSLGLTIMVDFMPTVLMMIFTSCFSLYDKGAAQYKLTVWYWWLNVLYVVMITALGTNFLSFVETLSKDPLKLFSLLADTMPECTHYYMNYIGMQAYSQAMVLTRYMPLIKYRSFLHSHDEQEAKDMAEPEDQDYYGIGSRTARWSTMACIGICYGTLSPPCSLLTFMIFFVIRSLYGYMFCYAESKKSDLGGIFFVRALHNMFISLHIYMILMLGVFCQRAGGWGPVLVVALAWVYVFHSQKKFSEYKWERLPYPELTSDKKVVHKVQESKGSYVQPELSG